MKKRHSKLIRALARRLPDSYEFRKHSQGIRGRDLNPEVMKRSGMKQKDVDVDKIYMQTGKRFFPINHYRKLKAAHSKNGEQGIIDYVTWLDRHNRNLMKEVKELNLERVDKGIMDVVASGAKSFWSNLVMFLYAFLRIFQKEEV